MLAQPVQPLASAVDIEKRLGVKGVFSVHLHRHQLARAFLDQFVPLQVRVGDGSIAPRYDDFHRGGGNCRFVIARLDSKRRSSPGFLRDYIVFAIREVGGHGIENVED